MAGLLIVGGSDAGIAAGLRSRQVDPQLEVTLLLADRFPNFRSVACLSTSVVKRRTGDRWPIGSWRTSRGRGCVC
ncbi:MAG: hypothetical protein M3O95_00845 [Candidatus Dormibacteraeota bacterium]|jgi:hypothetical protein|nr:hypothetical protein [Candidatus Dormibacteraeota bacterium]